MTIVSPLIGLSITGMSACGSGPPTIAGYA
jgi:hypothetical protein